MNDLNNCVYQSELVDEPPGQVDTDHSDSIETSNQFALSKEATTVPQVERSYLLEELGWKRERIDKLEAELQEIRHRRIR